MESFLKDALGLEVNLSEDDFLCFPYYKYFSSMLKSGACTLSNNDIVAKLKAKERHLASRPQVTMNL